ncbi:hypothetical protein [Timonella sp. A28]|uniref:hypothetical protein n=1 Tax=Timonella sp. A28 TaxID=3442640 RepID=UPI003EB7009C
MSSNSPETPAAAGKENYGRFAPPHTSQAALPSAFDYQQEANRPAVTPQTGRDYPPPPPPNRNPTGSQRLIEKWLLDDTPPQPQQKIAKPVRKRTVLRVVSGLLLATLFVTLAGALVANFSLIRAVSSEEQFTRVPHVVLANPKALNEITDRVVETIWAQTSRAEVINELEKYVVNNETPEELSYLLRELDQHKQLDPQIDKLLEQWLKPYIRGFLTSPQARTVWSEASEESRKVVTEIVNTGFVPRDTDLYYNGAVMIDLNELKALWAKNPTGLPAIDEAIAQLDVSVEFLDAQSMYELKSAYSIVKKICVALAIMALLILALGRWAARSQPWFYAFLGLNFIVLWAFRGPISTELFFQLAVREDGYTSVFINEYARFIGTYCKSLLDWSIYVAALLIGYALVRHLVLRRGSSRSPYRYV